MTKVETQTPSPFEAATRMIRTGECAWRAHTHPLFWNQDGAFGGWSAAVITRAALGHLEDGVEPLSLSIDFLGPVAAGDLDIAIGVARRNRSSVFLWARAAQGAAPLLHASIFAARRRESPAWVDASMPVVPPAAQCDDPYRGFSPWTRAYDLRHALGQPMSEGKSTRSLVWTELPDGEPLDVPRLAALCDASISRIHYLGVDRLPTVSVTMSCHFHRDAQELAAVTPATVLIDARSRLGRRGYYDQEATVWSTSGDLLATTTQLCWFAPRR